MTEAKSNCVIATRFQIPLVPRPSSCLDPLVQVPPHIIIIMGVAGSGKTTIGRALAEATKRPYFEADDFHPAENVAKMSRGMPLDDADRTPWLATIRLKIDECLAAGRPAVFSCSALKQSYRLVLQRGEQRIAFIHLQVDPALALARVSARPGHYMKSNMVESQFAALEPPADALVVDAGAEPTRIVALIRSHFGL